MKAYLSAFGGKLSGVVEVPTLTPTICIPWCDENASPWESDIVDKVKVARFEIKTSGGEYEMVSCD